MHICFDKIRIMSSILYQLANGRTVYLTAKQLLSMSDSDFQELEGSNLGTSINNPFIPLPKQGEETEEFIDHNSPDMLSDGDDIDYGEIDLDNIY